MNDLFTNSPGTVFHTGPSFTGYPVHLSGFRRHKTGALPNAVSLIRNANLSQTSVSNFLRNLQINVSMISSIGNLGFNRISSSSHPNSFATPSQRIR
jgi:hypothetical protein